MQAWVKENKLLFKQQSRTSREVLDTRCVWYLYLKSDEIIGVGECAPIFGLSNETPSMVKQALDDIIADPEYFINDISALDNISSVKFALETALLDLENGGKQVIFKSEFTQGKSSIPINGLVWMNNFEQMIMEIEKKISEGFKCIKLKVGAIDFESEISMIKHIRKQYSEDEIIIRLDANGGFLNSEAFIKLNRLSELNIHSIEQPIKSGSWAEMSTICENSPLPIALDEELIRINKIEDKKLLLDLINPHFLVLKPSLHGGFSGCNEWITLAEDKNIKWWVTSYLESNIGLNAIAQWLATKQFHGHQGLGTGKLYTNNIDSPLFIRGEHLMYNPNKFFKL